MIKSWEDNCFYSRVDEVGMGYMTPQLGWGRWHFCLQNMMIFNQ